MRWLDLAIKVAEANTDYPKWRLGAVIVKGGAVQAVGWNKWRSDPGVVCQSHAKRCSIHAERAALHQLDYSAPRATIYIARVTRSGLIGTAMPCEDCQKLLIAAGIRKAVFTTDAQPGVWMANAVERRVA